MPISVNQGISFTDPAQVKISGVVSGSKIIDDVSVTADDNVVTSSALNEDASWNTIVSFNNTKVELIVATAHYGDGTTDTAGLILSSNTPLDHQYASLFLSGGEYTGVVYGQHGRELYTFTDVADTSQQQFVDAIGSGGAGTTYTDFSGAFETIDNFRSVGPNHDALNLSDTSLQTLSQVLHHTTMSNGDATIHIASNETVTLSGISKAQLAAHPHDFTFTGGHTLS